MPTHKLNVTMCAPADDPFFAEVGFDTSEGSHVWAELFLANVDTSASGTGRVANARVVVHVYAGGASIALSFEEVVAVLERAKRLLLDGEAKVPAGQD